MTIENADKRGKEAWNDFVFKHYPPVGGFMQSWEWGEFQKGLGRNSERFFVTEDGSPVAAFTLIKHSLPFGMQYGYAARGPVVADSHQDKFVQVCEAIREWALKEMPKLIFLRLEPPIEEVPTGLSERDFKIPSYYIQPRYNLTIPLDKTEDEVLMSLHPSTRSNVRRSEKRGVTVDIRTSILEDEYEHFRGMMRDTIQRNSGTNAYPSDTYFDALFAVLSGNEALGTFYGYQNGEPAATPFVLFFGTTATYLYGAAYTKHLSSKVTTYLHWSAMKEAKRRGMKYYDLGGIDDKRWPKLTEFKRQFRGREFSYMGNIDIPLRPTAYRIYNLVRRLRNKN